MARSMKLDGGGQLAGRGKDAIVLPDTKRKPPAAPKHLVGKDERDLWRRLWSSPVSGLWQDEDVDLVLDLILLRVRLRREGSGAPLGVFGQVRSLEDRLFLSPRARRVAGIVLVTPDPPQKRTATAKRVDATRRARMHAGDA